MAYKYLSVIFFLLMIFTSQCMIVASVNKAISAKNYCLGGSLLVLALLYSYKNTHLVKNGTATLMKMMGKFETVYNNVYKKVSKLFIKKIAEKRIESAQKNEIPQKTENHVWVKKDGDYFSLIYLKNAHDGELNFPKKHECFYVSILTEKYEKK